MTLPSDAWGETVVRVYLPEAYERESTREFPVLYVMDGQNVFQKGAYGDWRFDETVEEMIGSGRLSPLLVVSIDHPQARLDAYTARRIWMPGESGQPGREEGGRAHDYFALLLRVRAEVEQRYPRTNGDNGLMGSSLGGVFALYAAFLPASPFRRVAALSPSFWWYGEPGVGELFAVRPDEGPERVWIDMGEAESGRPFRDEQYVESARLWAEWLSSCLPPEAKVRFCPFPDAVHSEAAWSQRLPEVLEFLYP